MGHALMSIKRTAWVHGGVIEVGKLAGWPVNMIKEHGRHGLMH
jgi:hypothetical protein